MKERLIQSVQEDVQKRQKRIGQLDPKVVELSQQLIKDEVKSFESFVGNEYFIKMSDSLFPNLPLPQQLLYLALWYCERGRSAPGNSFSFECQKPVEGQLANFIVYLRQEGHIYRVAVECGATNEKRRALERLGLHVLNFTTAEITQQPLALAEEAFTFLEDQAEKAVLSKLRQTLLL